MVISWQPLMGRSGHQAGRDLLARLYCETTGHPLPEIAVTDRGKPYFPRESLHFSISHTRDAAFCCLSQHPVGMDAEPVTRQIDPRLAKKILSPTEHAAYLAAEDKNAALLRLWVLKESYAKLTGRGWGSYLYETDFHPDDPRIQMIHGHYVAVLQEEDHAF